MTTIPFNTARGTASSLQMAPPFAFNDVTMSVFPLRASLPRLETFCRNYLNQAPHLLQFRPFIPFVYLVILDYGRMSLEAANMGWVSQREVAFGIPLRWLNAQGDGLHFHDWAFTTPFIFVDNELSMSTGREVYGWPKLLAKLDPTVSEWVRNPHGARRVFQVSTKRAVHAYSGETQKYHPFLSIYQNRAAGLFDIPPSMETITKPLQQLSSNAAGLARLGGDLLRTFAGMASDGITGSSVLPDMLDMDVFKAQLTSDRIKSWVNPKEWAPGTRDLLWSMFPRAYANTVNFKQFRDAGNPHAPCYQAITTAKMPVKSIKQGGLLGPQNMLLGQLDGGFRIDVHHLAGLPIVDSLGLEVSEEREAGGTIVSTLAPVCPLWLQVDMTYGLADTLVWRGREGDWKIGEAQAELNRKQQGETADSAEGVQTEERASQEESLEVEEVSPELRKPSESQLDDEPDDTFSLDYLRAMNFFNTARGATEAIGGAFSMPNASVRVLPLKANFEKLNGFVSDYLRVEDQMRFEAWGDCVYLVICDFEQMNSELNAIAKRRAREVNLVVPVKCYDWFNDGEYPERTAKDVFEHFDKGAKHMVSTGFVSVFSYVDDVGTAITASEVSGIPTMGSKIKSPENDWLRFDPSKNRAKRDILDLSAQILPALMSGAEASERSLIRLHSHTTPHTKAHESRHESVNSWVSLLADDLEKKEQEIKDPSGRTSKPFSLGLGFGLKLLGGDLAFNQFSLKQFRDSKHTSDACYQGLVMRRHRVQKLHDMRELEEPLHISITDYPTQPITEILGLIPKFTFPGKDRTVRVFEALRPISITADLYREAGNTLFERLGDDPWQTVDNVEQIFGWRQAAKQDGLDLIERANQIDQDNPVELHYMCKMPKKPEPFRVQTRKVTADFVNGRFANHLRRGKVTELMIRDRHMSGHVNLLMDEDLLRSVAADSAIDIAAFNKQIAAAGQETSLFQSEAAGTLETISPATILDSVLSRQWGLAPGSKRREYDKPNFCIPFNTVPNQFVDALFPGPELLHEHWPLTESFNLDQIRRRNSEVLGIKSELRTIVDLFWLMTVMMFDDSTSSGVDRALENMLNLIRETLSSEEQFVFDRALKKLELTEPDSQGGPPNIFLIFADSILPKAFRLDVQATNRGGIPDEVLKRHNMVTSGEWHALEKALERFFQFFEDFSGGTDEARTIVKEACDMTSPRITRNRNEMERVEAAKVGDGELEDFYLVEPYNILRQRLSKLITNGILETDGRASSYRS